jgi:serine/threonine-protein kinase
VASVGQVLSDRYRLVELLGEGGMATIYRAHDTQLGRDVAVKVLRAEYGRDAAFVARFRQEAQAAAALNHPNVVNVFDYGMEDGDPYIVMELVEGGDLAEVLRERGALEPVAAARIAQQVADALDAAHGRGIVHRDIKATNVLITRGGRIKVGDFGIARAFAEAQITMPGTTLGSVHYFSPEQARGELVTSASDIYSLGLVLFEMLTGRRAWTGDSAGAVAVARLAGDPPAPSSLQPGVPPALDAIVKAALARPPGERPTAADLSAALGRFVADPAAPAVLAAHRDTATAARPTAYGAGAAMGGAALGGAMAGGPMAGSPDGPPSPYEPAYGTYAGRGRGGRPPMAYRPDEDEEEQAGGPWGWIAAILAILVLLAGGVLVFLLLNGPGGPPSGSPTPALAEVPSLVGRSLAEARQVATTAGFVFTVSAYEQTDAQPEETVLTQSIPAGERVNAGSELSVVVATQKATVPVPDLRLRTEAELLSILLDANLIPGAKSEAYDPEVPASLIIRTNPRFGVEVARDTVVDYVVSLGTAPTASPSPSPTLPPTPSPTPTPTVPPTAPPTPTEPPTAPPTASPTPTPAPTPTPVTVGNYSTCGPVNDAEAQIVAAGLTVGVVWPEEFADDGFVQDQYPNAGDQVPPGTAVHLFVRGPAEACTPSF